jgi:hypothetical protein
MGILIFENSFVSSEDFQFSILALAPTVLICRHSHGQFRNRAVGTSMKGVPEPQGMTKRLVGCLSTKTSRQMLKPMIIGLKKLRGEKKNGTKEWEVV